MTATLVFTEKRPFGRGRVEIVIWRVPQPVPPSAHRFKYRMVYVVAGRRVIGFDNERGKGDHQHWRGVETPYRFTTIPALLADFWTAVKEAANGDIDD
ncbi:MAG: hypothetical protein EPN14_00525 [Gallionella sp.]|nr:MAG: hypothetical protein EPN14_00525 [Gallionella sp.]